MKTYILLLAFLTAVACRDRGHDKHRVEDPFALIDKHLTHTLTYHYMWPWSQLIRAAAALEDEDPFNEPQIVSDKEKFRVLLNVRRFKPDELRIKVKNRYIIVEGKHKDMNNEQPFLTNHFVQRFVMPPGSKQEEVSAVLKPNGILCVTVPKHDVPPPPPEREVPIEVILPEKVPEKVPEKPENPEIRPEIEDKVETSTEIKEVPALPVESSSSTPLEQFELVEATTHVGKIRKKELKTTTKTTKDNEVRKGLDTNGLDYALIEQEE